MQNVSMPRLIISYLTRFLGLFLVLFAVLAAIQAFIAVVNINKVGNSGIRYVPSEGSKYLVVLTVSQQYPSYSSGIMPGDTITKINNVPVSNQQLLKEELYNNAIGQKMIYTVTRSGIEKDYEITLAPIPPLEKLVIFLFRTVPVILLISYLIVGLWGILKSPYTTETILIALFCFCFGCFMYATVNVGTPSDTFVERYLYFTELREFVSYIMWLGPSFWILLFASFPIKNRIYENHKTVALIFIFLLPLIIILSSMFNVENSTITFLIFSLMFINMGIGVLLLQQNSKKVTTALEKRQVRLMLFGIKYGALTIGLGWLIVLLTQFILTRSISSNLLIVSFIIFLLCEIGGLIIPFTFLNSFFQNRLLETESALKRRVRYIGVTLGLIGIYLFIIFVIVRLAVNIFDIKDPTVIIISVLLLSLTFTPINKRILNWIDETFYPEKTRYADSLRAYIHRISAQIEAKELLSELERWVNSTIGIKPVIPLGVGSQYSLHSPFKHQQADSVLHRIRDGNKFFWDEISERSRITVDENEIEWVRENEISVTIPMISQGELIGVLNLGKKQNNEDFSADDLDVLTQASNQTALALQNLRLQSVYIDKKRMDKELEMARSIQQRLMPQTIPAVEGLDVHGESRPCFEVAGDYFDILDVGEGNTAMVIADVSGKGAGAAMIMANLQASIRVGIDIIDKTEFADFIQTINNHIYKNTSPSEFITFFMGIWNPKIRTLHYINAGHNPPILIDKNNDIKTLNATGLILGVLPDQKYGIETAVIEEGSVLAIYTDGLEEAMNPGNEIFGQERIIQSLIENRESGSREIIRLVQKCVLLYCQGKPLHDDLTMIVAKSFFHSP
jgi:serine phosphatase RsbU (regulator of sigma subunit)